MDFDRPVRPFLILLGIDGGGVGQFGVQLVIQLLARDFRRQHPVGGVRHLVFREMPRPFGHGSGEGGLELGQAIAGRGRHEEDFIEAQRLVQLLGMDEQLFLDGDIHLVEDQPLAFAAMLERFDDRLQLGAAPGLAIHHHRDQVSALGAAPGRLHHRAVQPTLGREDARRVDQHDLRIALDRDTHDAGACGLRLGTGDRHLLPHQRIDQRGLARIGRTDNGNDAAALIGF